MCFFIFKILEVTEQTETSISILKDISTSTLANSQTQKTMAIDETTKFENTTRSKISTTAVEITTAATRRRTSAETRATSRASMRPSTSSSTTMVSVETPFFVPEHETTIPSSNAYTQTGKYLYTHIFNHITYIFQFFHFHEIILSRVCYLIC
jgi:hypothetical protein